MPLAIAWGDEGRELGLRALDVRSGGFSAVSTWFDESAEIGPVTNSEQPADELPDQWFCSEPCDHKRFIDHLMFGDFAVDVLFEGSLEHLGRISRSRVVAGSSSLPWQHYLNICSVVYGSRKSLILDEFFRSRSNVHLFVRSGMPPRPLGQIMWFYRQLEPILRGVLAGEIALPTSIREARDVRPYSRGIRLDRQSMRHLVSGQLATSHSMSMDSMEREVIPSVVDAPIALKRFAQLDNKLFVQLLSEIHVGLSNFIEGLDLIDGALTRQAQALGQDIATLCWRYKINRFGPLISGIPDKYVRSADSSLKRLGALIVDWNSYYDLDMEAQGTTQLYSVHTTEVLWEFFCLEKLIRSMVNVGFVEERREQRRVLLQRGELEVAIQYGGSWKSGSQELGLKNLHLTKELKPDYVVTLTGPGIKRIGVMDAKYTPAPTAWQARSTELFEKYGLYLRKPSNSTLDFVLGLVPSATAGERKRLLKVSQAGEIDLDLGYISLQMDEEDSSGEHALANCILGSQRL